MGERKQSKLDIEDFMNTCEEFHAFAQGLCEVVCPWPPFRKLQSEASQNEILNEYHYYLFGRAVGVVVLIGLAAAIKGIFF